MKKKGISIKNRLILSATGILFILLALGFIINYSIKEFSNNYKLLASIKDVTKEGLYLKRIEKDFTLKETINPSFYESGVSLYDKDFQTISNNIKYELGIIGENKLVYQSNLTPLVDSIKILIDLYTYDFVQLVELTKIKGFKDYGLVGEMRDIIHDVEDKVKQNKDLSSNIFLLTLRRHEKDYLLRKDLKYKKNFDSVIEEFIAHLSNQPVSKQAQNNGLISSLKKYRIIFFKVIDKDICIGLTGDDGITTELNNHSTSIENSLSELHEQIYNASNEKIRYSMLIMFLAISLFSITILLILQRISREIVHSITKLKSHIEKLGNGEIPEKIKIRYRNEIAEMIEQINILTDNLNNTKKFALEVGKGNLETDINVFNNKGDLGGSLIEMRNQLLKVSREREEQKIKDERRIWINEGIAELSHIMRSYNDNLKELAFQFIRTLVKYMKANQAGIFLIDEENKDDVVFDLVAAYAYNRKKFVQQKVKIGEGLVGTCAIEKEHIYLTEIPKEYINITSGLGEAPPSCLVLMPLLHNNEVLGVIEIASFNNILDYELDFLKNVADNFAITLGTVRNNSLTSKLLERSQKQAEELLSNEEELRQNLEELKATQEEVGRKEHNLKREIEKLKREKEENTGVLLKELKRVKRVKKEYNAMLDSVNTTVLIGELNLHEEILSVNKKFEITLGYSKNELIGKKMRDLIPENDKDDFLEVWDSVIKGKTRERIGKRTTKHGQEIWLKTTYTPVFDEKNNIEKVFFIAKDISPEEKLIDKNGIRSKDDIKDTTKKLENNLKYFVELQNNWTEN